MNEIAEAKRRRTFAIISHPDAGKTTLTEKFLLYSGAVQEAGAVHAREGRRSARSDWMELEQQRGISISSTVMQFPYRDHIMNLLDTPGHRDFSEDTYRVLAAVDAVVMVLDAAQGHRGPDAEAVPGVPLAQPAGDHLPQQVRPAGARATRAARRDRSSRSSSAPRRSRGRSAAAKTSTG